MIQLTQEEIWTINMIGGSMQTTRAELSRLASVQTDYITKLEAKYDAVYDLASGQLKPKEGKEG